MIDFKNAETPAPVAQEVWLLAFQFKTESAAAVLYIADSTLSASTSAHPLERVHRSEPAHGEAIKHLHHRPTIDNGIRHKERAPQPGSDGHK
ncbi:hypothetical protein FOCC_FOCC008884 [Frankliniella occidentalis]|nr:hypothetical protein FOCC_FOCC008884 [Frankliniella occidentalis]